ncbi:Metallo-dependent phosphatase [Serendipita vermifera]|nr:Metallo-dependent phosphatase [Serendipita vermifera]
MSTILNILHFNDVYRVSKQPVEGGTIDVSQWAQMVDDRRNEWPTREDGKRDGLLLFSGDVFSPSIESSVTRGSHMVPIMNAVGIDCAVAGNHDFDWSAPHFLNLVKDSNYPWLLSNIIDSDTGKVPEGLGTYEIIERAGARIGLVGLVEEEWIQTISSWPPNYKYKDMKTVALDLSKELRDPNGPHKVDFIIALTHSRVPNDIALAQAIHARAGDSVVNEHGCDILLGGHDHFYYVSKVNPDPSSNPWTGYDIHKPFLGAEKDDGVLLIKSGTDFRDLSEIKLELKDSPEGSIRKKYISSIQGARLSTKPDMQRSQKVSELLDKLVGDIEESLNKPVCKLDTELNCKSDVVRIGESASGNWFADVIFHAYDDALCLRGEGGADAVFICGGTLRGDSTYGPGYFTVGNILEILPFQDPIVVLKMDGPTIWAALESALETWPAQEGRFPIVSGFRVEWDSRRPKGQRVLSVKLARESHGPDDHDDSHSESGSVSGAQTPVPMTLVDVINESGGPQYNVVTRLYMAQGFDGYDAFKGCTFLVDEENGRIMSDLVRHYLLGRQYINTMKSLEVDKAPSYLSKQTSQIIASEQKKHANGSQKHGSARWAEIVRKKVIKPSKRSAVNSYHVALNEHMSGVDCVDGARFRGAIDREKEAEEKLREDMIVCSPRIDGRLKDVGRQ